MAHFPVEKEVENPFAYNPNVIPVPVIASFDTKGRIVPLFIRYEGLKLKVDHLKWTDDRMAFALKYCCEITLQDRVQGVILYYHKRLDMWVMERIRE